MGSWLQYWNSQHGLLRLTSHISDRPSPSCSKQTHYSSQNDIFECFFKSLIFPFISRFTSSTPWTILFSYLEYGYNFWSVRPYSGVILTKSKSDQGILMHKAHQRFSTAQTRGFDMIFSLGIFLSCPLSLSVPWNIPLFFASGPCINYQLSASLALNAPLILYSFHLGNTSSSFIFQLKHHFLRGD